MSETGIRASGYQLADIPVPGGLFFEYGSLFMKIFEVGTDEGSKMLVFSLGVACGAKMFEYFTSKMRFLMFLRSRDLQNSFFNIKMVQNEIFNVFRR